jgi:predicted dehydrogenase
VSERKKVGFAVVGLGIIAQGSVLPAFARCKKARLAAVVGRDEKKAAQLARKFKASHCYTAKDFAACFKNPEVDAVYIATPPGEHVHLTVQAARSGKHVLCEKPLAATVEQSAQMVEACRQSGVLLMTAYRKYFEPSCIYIKKIIESEALGQIDVIHTAFSELFNPGVSPSWLLDSKLAGGGPLTDLGIYCVNTTRWLLGEDPVRASAQVWSRDTARFRQVEEGISFRLEYPSGIVQQGSSTYSSAMSSIMFIQGTKGRLLLTPAYNFDEPRRLTGMIGHRPLARTFKVVDEFAPEIDAFSSAILEGRSILPDGEQGHRDMLILRAIYDSARRQEPVTVQYRGEYGAAAGSAAE